MGARSMVGEIALVAIELLLWYFADTGLVLPRTLHAVDNSTIFYQVLPLHLKHLSVLMARAWMARGWDGTLVSYCTTQSRSELKLNGRFITYDEVN